MKILLVDDEKLVLQGLKMLISMIDPNFKTLSTFNGREALKLATQYNPDIIITDIRMPIMDGLEFCEELKKQQVHARIIIISGYEDFDYARRAIDLGAINYVLKPIDQDHFACLINKIASDIRAERQNKASIDNAFKMARKKLLTDLIRYQATPSSIVEKINKSGVTLSFSSYHIAIMEIDDYFLLSESRYIEDLNDFYQQFFDKIDKIIQTFDFDIVYTENKPGEFVFLSMWNNNSPDINLIESILEQLKKDLDISITMGVGKMQQSITAIYQTYQEALLAVKKSFFQGKGFLYIYDEVYDKNLYNILSQNYENINLEFLNNYSEMIISAISRGDYKDAKQSLDDFFNELAHSSYSPEVIHTLCFEMFMSISKRIFEMGENIQEIMNGNIISYAAFSECKTLNELKSLLSNILDATIQNIAERDKEHYNYIIDTVSQLAREEYASITLQSAAERVKITPVYLSILFKEKTGENFKDYVLKIKMAAAKDLLLNTSYKIYEIAEQVGYSDFKHFSKIFKKVTGLNPTEYRKSKYYG